MRCKITEIKYQEDIPPLVEACVADNHFPIAPTHIVWKEGQIGGYASVGGCPTIHAWSNSKCMKAIDSLRCLRFFEQLAIKKGYAEVVVPVHKDSPFFTLFERLGYKNVMETNVFWKKF